jgi:hypothetical protein
VPKIQGEEKLLYKQKREKGKILAWPLVESKNLKEKRTFAFGTLRTEKLCSTVIKAEKLKTLPWTQKTCVKKGNFIIEAKRRENFALDTLEKGKLCLGYVGKLKTLYALYAQRKVRFFPLHVEKGKH